MADREFIGKEWTGWLNSRRIRYYIRIRQNFRIVKPSTGERIRAWWHKEGKLAQKAVGARPKEELLALLN